jgi:hypothetical protein
LLSYYHIRAVALPVILWVYDTGETGKQTSGAGIELLASMRRLLAYDFSYRSVALSTYPYRPRVEGSAVINRAGKGNHPLPFLSYAATIYSFGSRANWPSSVDLPT